MTFYFFTILAFATAIPVLAGVLRTALLLQSGFFPVFLCVLLGFMNETLSYSLITTGHSNHFNSNIYVLVAFGLLLWQLRNWDDRPGRKYVYWMAAGTLVWVADNLILHSLYDNNALFRFTSSAILLYAFLSQINRTAFWQEKKGATTPILMIGTGYIVHFSCKLSVEFITAFEPVFGTDMLIQSYLIIAFINVITYLCISAGFLLIRRRVLVYHAS